MQGACAVTHRRGKEAKYSTCVSRRTSGAMVHSDTHQLYVIGASASGFTVTDKTVRRPKEAEKNGIWLGLRLAMGRYSFLMAPVGLECAARGVGLFVTLVVEGIGRETTRQPNETHLWIEHLVWHKTRSTGDT